MPAIAIRKSVFDGLPRHKQTVFRVALSLVVLGEPAHYTDGTNEWFIYDDSRITRDDLSWVGALAANLIDIPDTYHLPVIIRGGEFVIDRATVQAEAQAFLAAKRVAPAEYDEDLNPAPANIWQAVLDDNGAPAAIKAANTVPEGWTPVEA